VSSSIGFKAGVHHRLTPGRFASRVVASHLARIAIRHDVVRPLNPHLSIFRGKLVEISRDVSNRHDRENPPRVDRTDTVFAIESLVHGKGLDGTRLKNPTQFIEHPADHRWIAGAPGNGLEDEDGWDLAVAHRVELVSEGRFLLLPDTALGVFPPLRLHRVAGLWIGRRSLLAAVPRLALRFPMRADIRSIACGMSAKPRTLLDKTPHRLLEDLLDPCREPRGLELLVESAHRAGRGRSVQIRADRLETQKASQVSIATELIEELLELTSPQVKAHGPRVPHRPHRIVVTPVSWSDFQRSDQRLITFRRTSRISR